MGSFEADLSALGLMVFLHFSS